MKYNFIYTDGTKHIFRGKSLKDTVEQADALVPEHDMVINMEELSPIKGFGIYDSRKWLTLRNGLLGEIEPVEKGYEFTLWRPEEERGEVYRGSILSGGVIPYEECTHGNVLLWLDQNYGCAGTGVKDENGRDDIIIESKDAFASVFENHIDFKFNIQLGAIQIKAIEEKYGNLNSVLCHVAIDKERNMEITTELYLSDLSVVNKDVEATKTLLTERQLQKIENYTKVCFVGRETEFDLSDGNKTDLDSWDFHKCFVDSGDLCDIKDIWIDQRQNEYTLCEITIDGETYSYLKVFSTDLHDVRCFEMTGQDLTRENAESIYETELSESFLNALECGYPFPENEYEIKSPSFTDEDVMKLAAKIDQLSYDWDPYGYKDAIDISSNGREENVNQIYINLRLGNTSAYHDFIVNEVFENINQDQILAAKAVLSELCQYENSYANKKSLYR